MDNPIYLLVHLHESSLFSYPSPLKFIFPFKKNSEIEFILLLINITCNCQWEIKRIKFFGIIVFLKKEILILKFLKGRGCLRRQIVFRPAVNLHMENRLPCDGSVWFGVDENDRPSFVKVRVSGGGAVEKATDLLGCQVTGRYQLCS